MSPLQEFPGWILTRMQEDPRYLYSTWPYQDRKQLCQVLAATAAANHRPKCITKWSGVGLQLGWQSLMHGWQMGGLLTVISVWCWARPCSVLSWSVPPPGLPCLVLVSVTLRSQRSRVLDIGWLKSKFLNILRNKDFGNIYFCCCILVFNILGKTLLQVSACVCKIIILIFGINIQSKCNTVQ